MLQLPSVDDPDEYHYIPKLYMVLHSLKMNAIDLLRKPVNIVLHVMESIGKTVVSIVKLLNCVKNS